MAAAVPAAAAGAAGSKGAPVTSTSSSSSSTSKAGGMDAATKGLLFGLAVLVLSNLLPWSASLLLSLALGFGGWWYATNSLEADGAGDEQAAAGGTAAAAAPSSPQQQQQDRPESKQDEDLGLEPPNYAAGGRSMTARGKPQAAAPPKAPAAAPQQAAMPPVAGGAAVPARAAPAAVAAGAAIASVAAAAATSSSSSSSAQAPSTTGRAAAVAALRPAQAEPLQAPPPAAAPAPAQQHQPPAGAAMDAAAPPVALTGSAAILAKLRQQRSASGGGATAAKQQGGKVTVLYASQTGTGQEIARSIHAECAAQGVPAQVMSLNELGFDNLKAETTPVVVVVASSTGDGDPPDNAAAAFVALKKPWPADRLAGVRFTVLGLGDSNYTRFMHVPRAIKSRLQDLGATCFFPCAEADEVDGLESTVDPWIEAVIKPAQQALQQHQQPPAAAAPAASTESSKAGLTPEQSSGSVATVVADATGAPPSGRASLAGEGAAAAAAATVAAAAAAAAAAASPPPATPPTKLVTGLAPKGVDLKGVPPLAPCRIRLLEQDASSGADAVRAREAALPSSEQRCFRDATGDYSATAPFWATVADAKRLTAEASDRTVLHVELDLADSGMQFGPGDAVGVLPRNDPALVAGVLARLGLDGDAVYSVAPADGGDSAGALLGHIPWPCTLRHALSVGADLTSLPRKSLLRLLAEHCGDEDEQRTLLFLASRAGREAYAEEVTAGQPSLLDLLRRFASCRPPLDALLDALPPLAPRMYSLVNAPVEAGSGVPGAVGGARVQFALSVVQFATPNGTRRGVASTWLADLCQPWLAAGSGGASPTWVPLFLRRAVSFKPPASLDVPLIMIGPGTGVAPFRGFLQQRLADMQAAGASSSPAPSLLYFGCRRPDEDYLYADDWRALQDAGALTRLRVAFSRAQEHKVYVQHLLREDAAEVARLIAAGAHVYVCGDGAGMAKDVHAALAVILRDQLGLSEVQAAEELAAMAKQGRYSRDIWS